MQTKQELNLSSIPVLVRYRDKLIRFWMVLLFDA